MARQPAPSLSGLLRPEVMARAHPLALAAHLRPKRFGRPPHLEHVSRLVADRVLAGRARLLISIPPQHGKSQTVAEALPTWLFDRDPSHRILAASYSERLGTRATSCVRDLAREFAPQLRFSLSPDKASESYIQTLRADGTSPDRGAGYMRGVGILGSITGDAYDTVILDDLYKGPEEADSASHREKVERQLSAVIQTRLSADGNIIGIMTRWHAEDAFGTRIATDAGWEVVNIPAIAEADDPLGRAVGAPLWPESKPLKFLEEMRDALGPRLWAALYQGKPSEHHGSMFQRGWVSTIDARPDLVRRRVRYWDMAAARKQSTTDPDYAVGVLMSEMRPDIHLPYRYVVEDIRRMQSIRPGDIERLFLATAQADGRAVPIEVEQEPGSESELYIAHLRRQLPGHIVNGVRHGTDKVTRAKPVSARMELGEFAVVRASWNAPLFAELEVFPDEREHDDQVDALTGAWEHFTRGGAAWPWQEIGRSPVVRREAPPAGGRVTPPEQSGAAAPPAKPLPDPVIDYGPREESDAPRHPSRLTIATRSPMSRLGPTVRDARRYL